MAEILAPAGAEEQLKAAVYAGADAVYLGFGAFNARRNAKNFDDLRAAVSFCHARGVKVHVTLNTLVLEKERGALENDLRVLADSGADAVIVQDLGVARMIRESIPPLPMHASTQLTVHNAAGVRLMKELGFRRVVLSRELSLEEIRAICQSTDLEIEVFVHGALCMCVSGGCYLSAMLGQRSGNRGLCAQPCRLDFTVNGRDHALSLKDMSHLAYVRELEEAGVCSFKIEGRMKRPEYVAAAVTACRKALAGETPDMQLLQAVFSRSGFTDGYLKGKRDLSMFGYRQKEDVVAAQGALKDAEKLYKSEFPRLPVSFTFSMRENEPITLSAVSENDTVCVSGLVPEAARTRSITKDDVVKQLRKTGGTPFYAEDPHVELPDGLTVPLAEINRLRREALEALTSRKSAAAAHPVKSFTLSPCAERGPFPKRWIRVHSPKQAEGLENECLIVPLKDFSRALAEKHACVAAELPSLIFPGDEEALARLLREKKAEGLTTVVCENAGAVTLAREAGLEFMTGALMNTLNSVALDELAHLGAKASILSFETDLHNAKSLQKPIPTGLIVYGYLPLMRFRACPAQRKSGCGDCRGLTLMRDRRNTEFLLQCQGRKFTTMLNSVPLYVGDRMPETDFYVLYFTHESPDEVRRVIGRIDSEEPFGRDFTRGLYDKQLR